MTGHHPLPLKAHTRLDYAFVGLGLLAPWALGYSEHAAATLYTLALALFGLVLNLVTDYPGGLWKWLPFRWHRIVEWASPPPFMVVPWLFFADAGAMPWFLSGLGAAIVLNAAFTRPVAAHTKRAGA